MAGTTLGQDIAEFNRISSTFSKAPTSAHGGLVFAGVHWPPKATNTLKYRDVELAIGEARSMVVKGYLVASAALRGDADASQKMTRWFGARTQHTGFDTPLPDWWLGARAIIGAVDDFIMKNVSVYYRGDAALVGKPNDYPGGTGNLNARDVAGYAESSTSVRDNVIGLCKLFFAKTTANGQAKMNVRGKDSIGGTLVHELSHNICGTDDHETHDDSGTCYGTAGCLELATHKPSRAWYNADNIEYFCEDVTYSI